VLGGGAASVTVEPIVGRGEILSSSAGTRECRQLCCLFRVCDGFLRRVSSRLVLSRTYPYVPTAHQVQPCFGRSAIEDGCTDVVVLCTRPKGSQVLGKVRPVERSRSPPSADGQGMGIFHAPIIFFCLVRAGIPLPPSASFRLLPPRFPCITFCAPSASWRFALWSLGGDLCLAAFSTRGAF